MSDPRPIGTPGAGGPRAGRAGVSADAGGRERSWTVLELLSWTTDYFKRAGIESARLDAEVLLAHALQSERLRLYIDYEKPVLPAERDAFRELVRRRAQERLPVSLLLGQREFWSLAFKVSGDVLTPRPETSRCWSLLQRVSKPYLARKRSSSTRRRSPASTRESACCCAMVILGIGSKLAQALAGNNKHGPRSPIQKVASAYALEPFQARFP